MKIRVVTEREQADGSVPVICLLKGQSVNEFTGLLKQLSEADKFNGEDGQLYHFTTHNENQLQDVILIGLGESKKLTHEKVRRATGKAAKKVKELKATSMQLDLTQIAEKRAGELTKAAVEGILLADYSFTKYKSENKEMKLLSLTIAVNGIATELDSAVEEGRLLAQSTILARDLKNEPANVLTPSELADQAVLAGKDCGFAVQVFDERKIEELGMEAFLSVAKGSTNPPKFIVMKYFGRPEDKDNILGLVGKGLTYDSGGYSIKPTDSMLHMKSDMGGAAAVIGALTAIATAQLKVNVVAVVATCENMIAGNAYKPGDIIGSMGGKKIEVVNTDAEGRLTLVDAMHYIISMEKVNKVIDVATLTGAVLMALGTTITGVVTNNQVFFADLQNAAEASGEKFWQLPSDESYKKLIKSEIADLKNSGGRLAGTVTAGLFIGEYVGELPWLHLDIAGTSWCESSEEYFFKGATGVGVRTLYYMAKNLQ